MEHAIVILFALAVFAFLITLIAISNSRTRRKARKGPPPETGRRLLDSSYDSNKGAMSAAKSHLPNDAPDHAKAMMPKSKGNAK